MDNKIKSLSKIAENRRMSSDSGMALVLILLVCYAFLGIRALLIAAIAVLVMDMTVPIVFLPFAKLWFGFSRISGSVMSKLLLGLVFFIVVTPTGLFRRLLGKDALRLRQFKKGNGSVFEARDGGYTAADLDKPF
ncbi:hypothetical protein J5834_02700 [bacterium]|nr:hypothetical protein [bacterium]